jgi:hypothetical protein
MQQPEPNATETAAVNPLVLALAADAYAARQTRISNPSGRFVGPRFYLSDEEYKFVPEGDRDRLNPSNRFPYSLMTYARSKKHVAALFGVPVEALTAEVARRNQQRRRRASRDN